MAVGSHELAVNGPGRFIVKIMGEKTLKGAGVSLEDSRRLQTLDNCNV